MSSPRSSAKRARFTRPAIEPARTSSACTACRERKIKCSGECPCRYCSRKQFTCTFPENVRKKMYSVAYVEELEKRASILSRGQAERADALPGQSLDTLSCESGFEVTGPELNLMPSPIVSESTMSSSLNFGSRIRNLPNSTTHINPVPHRQLSKSPDNVYNLEPEGPKYPEMSEAPSWPTEDEAHGLLDTVLNSIGRLQHLIDPRTFSDKLSAFYEDSRDGSIKKDLWYVEMLMVFALGGLLQGKLSEGASFPGAQYFLEAVKCLPSLCALRSAGTLAIEIMGLFAFFLQCSDRKDDAYVYAGVALRLALSNGLSRGSVNSKTKRSEKIHRNRLWWTIYMQERRLAAATGNPVGVHDEVITTELPAEAPGFGPTGALNINIKLARLTGKIIQDIYGHKTGTERQFLARVQSLLSELTDIRKAVPSEYAINFMEPFSVTRTSATLHLMLFQATILTTRSILLHIAKSRLEGANLDNLMSRNSPLQKLAATCIEAAGRNLDVLMSLKQQGILAKFGFFDLDAGVSSAFIFILAETIHSENSIGSGVQGISLALAILRYLTSQGNKSAEKRCSDIEQMCLHLGIRMDPTDPLMDSPTDQRTPTNNMHPHITRREASHSPGGLLPAHEAAADLTNAPFVDSDWRHAFIHPRDPSNSLDGNLTDDTFLPHGNFDGLIFDFSGDFMLTGADETDWGEFERQVARLQD